ncbi:MULTISPECIES: FeoB-associated Cys-rich membrane protein [unclassified Oceanispirochaeta]|nr:MULTISPECIES: FeoB-associated Cys-rich membrane protein [unclassified Oceanispirochaeta]
MMTTTDILIIGVIIFLIAGALWKILKDKKKGAGCSGCTGCPMSGQCNVPLEEKG